MKKRKDLSNRKRQLARALSASAAVLPMALNPALAASASAAETAETVSPLQDRVNSHLSDGLMAGESIAVDLEGVFHEPGVQTFTVINHNPHIAGVNMDGGVLNISGKRPGSTLVEVLAAQAGQHDWFRLTVLPNTGLNDLDGDGIGIDDVVRYVASEPNRPYRKEDIENLMSAIPAASPVLNRKPDAEEEPYEIRLSTYDSASVELSDFFFDADGDSLTYSVIPLSAQLAEVFVDGSTLSVASTGEEHSSEYLVTASDGNHSEYEAQKWFTISVDDGLEEPEALYDHIEVSYYANQDLTIDMSAMFRADEDYPYIVASTDGQNNWSESLNGATVFADFFEGQLTFFVSGSIVQDTDLSFSFHAVDPDEEPYEGATTTVTVTMKPYSEYMPEIVLEEGTTVSLSETFSAYFPSYELDDAPGEFEYELSFSSAGFSWIETDEADSDLVHVLPDTAGNYSAVEVIARAAGGIEIVQPVTLVSMSKTLEREQFYFNDYSGIIEVNGLLEGDKIRLSIGNSTPIEAEAEYTQEDYTAIFNQVELGTSAVIQAELYRNGVWEEPVEILYVAPPQIGIDGAVYPNHGIPGAATEIVVPAVLAPEDIVYDEQTNSYFILYPDSGNYSVKQIVEIEEGKFAESNYSNLYFYSSPHIDMAGQIVELYTPLKYVHDVFRAFERLRMDAVIAEEKDTAEGSAVTDQDVFIVYDTEVRQVLPAYADPTVTEATYQIQSDGVYFNGSVSYDVIAEQLVTGQELVTVAQKSEGVQTDGQLYYLSGASGIHAYRKQVDDSLPDGSMQVDETSRTIRYNGSFAVSNLPEGYACLAVIAELPKTTAPSNHLHFIVTDEYGNQQIYKLHLNLQA